MLASDPDAMPSHSPEWIDAVCAGSLWQDASRLYVLGDGRRVVFPLTRSGFGGLSALVSPRRGWGYGGIIADGGVRPEDVTLVSMDLEVVEAVKFRVRPNPLTAGMWDRFVPTMRRVAKHSHIVDLDGGYDAVRARFRRSAVKGVTVAERHGVRIETAPGDELLPVFFTLTYKSRRSWAQRQHEPLALAQLRGGFRDSQMKWRCIARHLGDRFRVSVAWHGQHPVAAGIVLNGPNAHGIRAAMDPAFKHLGASHLLNAVVLHDACADGARWFNMGESANQGASAFKEFLGARRYEYDELELERIPISRTNELVRTAVKRAVGFRDGTPS